jgi:neutral ceramidase
MRLIWKILIGFFALIVLLANALISEVDRTPFQEELHFEQTLSALSRYYEYRKPHSYDSLSIGWARMTLVPDEDIREIPMAGYGARDPKFAETLHDSVSVRTFYISNGQNKLALVSAELLIIHPEFRERVYQNLVDQGWQKDEIYFGATHSHSSLGAWAPGLVGDLFAGEFQPEMITWLGDQISKSILTAEVRAKSGLFSFSEIEAPEFIRNRLVGSKGEKDTMVKSLIFQTEAGKAIDITYGAHATCLTHHWKQVSGDYPAVLMQMLVKDTLYDFANFRAGAVASMGTGNRSIANLELALWMGKGLYDEITFSSNRSSNPYYTAPIESYKIPLYLGEPQLKISTNLRLRPWVFRKFVGEYPVDISVASIGPVLMIGLPCDFSGELALPLYQYAKEKNLTLFIHSFNGGYIGYVPADKWYDLNKYETRTMSWYGHDTGAYLSTLIKTIIDHHAL